MRATSRAHADPGPLLPQLSLASSAGRLIRRAPTSRSPACTSTMSAPIPFLLLIRDLCMKLGVLILTGDFDKGAERELASSTNRPASDLSARRSLQPCQCSVTYFGCYATVGSRRRVSKLHVPRMLRFCRAPRIGKPVVDYAPRVHQRRPCNHWVEDHGPNLALRAVAPPPVFRPQTQEGRVSGRLEIPAEVFAAHQTNERPASCVLCF